jgi:hypothetical protein
LLKITPIGMRILILLEVLIGLFSQRVLIVRVIVWEGRVIIPYQKIVKRGVYQKEVKITVYLGIRIVA